MIRRPPRSTQSRSSAASDVYKRQIIGGAIMKTLNFPHIHGLDYLARSRMPVAVMFSFYVLPMSLIPPLMLYYAGTTYHDNLLPALALTINQLQILSGVFFVAELAGVFLMGGTIE